MPCPHHRSSDDEDHGIDRREFMKAALAIGGTSSLAAVQARAHGDGHDGSPPQGTDDYGSLPDRQFAMDEYSKTNERTGLAKFPEHHLQFMLDYTGDGTPSDAERERVEAALQTLERAFEWSHEGLMFTMGYSGSYFDRYDEDLPENTGLRPPEEVIEEGDIARSGDIAVDDYDVHMHLTGDSVVALLEAEAALFGDSDEVNGIDVEDNFVGVFEKQDRRTGFVGNAYEEWEEHIAGENPLDEDAPVWFGFASLFTDSQPREDEVAIESDHPFGDGTTEQVSLLRDEGIKEWYEENSHDDRVKRMFSPHHSSEDTGEHSAGLGATSGTDEMSMSEIAELTEEDAEERNLVGHSQKIARARDPRPPILRRDFPSTDGNRNHTQFISNQRSIDEFIEIRKMMGFVNPDDNKPAESEVPLKNHGIQGYLQAESRGTFLVPPRGLRALPPANP